MDVAVRVRLIAVAASWSIALVGACSSFGTSQSDPSLPAGNDGGSSDASRADGDIPADSEAPDAIGPACSHSKAFGAPVPVPGLPIAGPDCGVMLTNDELRAYFSSGTANNQRLMVASRPSLGAEFTATLLAIDAPTVTNVDDISPALSDDELTLVFASTRNNPSNRTTGYDLFYAQRASAKVGFQSPTELPLSSSTIANDAYPFIAGSEIWFASARTTTLFRIFKTTVNAQSGPVAVTELGTGTKNVIAPVLSKDLLSIYFATVSNGEIAVFRAERQKPIDTFAAITPVTELDGRSAVPAWLSSDNCRLYLCVKIDTNYTIQVATRPP